MRGWVRQYQRINARFFLLDLETEAGTYVKEFVSPRPPSFPCPPCFLSSGHMSGKVSPRVGGIRLNGRGAWALCWVQVHGDMGRTQPSLAGLLQCDAADILQLDVVAVQH